MVVQHSVIAILTAALATVAGRAASAFAQPQHFFIETSNLVTPEQPTTDIRVWAAFDADYYAFAGALFDIRAGVDEGWFHDPALPEGFSGDVGEISQDGTSVNAVFPYQWHLPLSNVFADTSNPLLIWRCSWTTNDFTPRWVDAALLATEFGVYFDNLGYGGLVPFDPSAVGRIRVVPAPGAAGALGLAALAAARRRRRE